MASSNKVVHVTEAEAMEVAEAARQTTWEGKSLMREIFNGRLHLDWIDPFPEDGEHSAEFLDWLARLRDFMEQFDPNLTDRIGDYPPEMIQGLAKLGCFGMKVPKKYGGLGHTQSEYCKALAVVGQYDGSVVALLSAHQSIGVPQPLKLFGNEEQKQKWLPRIAAGAISAFALTEPDVGSDPARLATSYRIDGDEFVINGEKLWCTNGTLAELIIVMARSEDNGKISAFVVEADAPGYEVTHRCHFMGLKALANGVITFKDVRVPKIALVGKEGHGLRIALTTLNTGRLSIPAAAVSIAKGLVKACREWSSSRVQWGKPVGKHQAVGLMLTHMAADTFAMEAISHLGNRLSELPGYDIRLEAAAAKEWNTTRGWHLVDTAMQIRGGRGYETEDSLRARGEEPIPIERVMRDFRINTIFEGSSEIMHLFMAREAVDTHFKNAGALVNPKSTTGEKLAAIVKMIPFYAWWYPSRYLGMSMFKYGKYGKLAKHARFADRKARHLSRASFHGMVLNGPKLQNEQGFLFRVVDIGTEIFAMAAVISYATRLAEKGGAEGAGAIEMADIFCTQARRRIRGWFGALWANDDKFATKVSRNILDGKHLWLEELITPLPEVKPYVEIESKTDAA